MDISQKIKESIRGVLGELGISAVDFVLEHPTELSHGDYASNVAMVAYRWMASHVDAHVPGGEQDGIIWMNVAKNPQELAMRIKEKLDDQKIPEIESIEVKGPGFINFKLPKSFFASVIPEIISAGETFGNVKIHGGKKILVEHSSPNLFKAFHVGHMMNNAIGESFVRLMQVSGAKIETMSFPSDISLGVAKAIFIILEKRQKEESSFNPHDTIMLGDAYV